MSTAYLIGTLTGALAMPLAGRLIDGRGLRWATLAFGTAFGAVLIGMSAVMGFATLAVGFALTRMLGQGALTLTATTSVAVWFDRSRGAALGILAAAGGSLMSLVPLAGAALIGAMGWRSAWIVLGLVIWAVTIPLGCCATRNPPRHLGPSPVDHALRAPTTVVRLPATAAEDWPVRDVLRSRPFRVIALTAGFAAAVGTGLVFHQVALLGARGLSEVQAAANFIPQTVAAAVAALAAGRLADRADPRKLMAAATLTLGGAGVSVLCVNGPATAALYGAGVGASASAIRTIEGAVLPRWFGVARIGELRGIVMSATVAGSAVGPMIVSASADLGGSYAPALWGFAAVAGALAATTLLTRLPVPQRTALDRAPPGLSTSMATCTSRTGRVW